MQRYENADAYMANPPGLGMAAARFPGRGGGRHDRGGGQPELETFPSEVDGNYVPLHTYLLAQTGTPIIELAYLEDLSCDQVYEFAFIGGSLKLRGSDAAPFAADRDSTSVERRKR